MLTLEPSESHFWLCRPDELDASPSYQANLEEILDEEELSRMRRFKFDEHRTLFRISHAFTRYVLSQYAALKPMEWQFVKGKHGKPYISNVGFEDLFFSLSHTKGLIAVYVAKGSEIGCDVEGRSSKVRGRDIAKRFFSTDEVEEYMACHQKDRLERFFDYWALKESYIKAKGKGLALPLGTFSFRLNERPISFSSDHETNTEVVNWTFQLLDVGAEHAGAIATRQPLAVVKHWQGRPLLGYEAVELRER